MQKTIAIGFIALNIYSSSFTTFRTPSKRLINTIKVITKEQQLASVIMKQELLCNLSASTVFRKINTIEKYNKKIEILDAMKHHDNLDIAAAWAVEKAIMSKAIPKFNATLQKYLNKYNELEQLEEELYHS